MTSGFEPLLLASAFAGPRVICIQVGAGSFAHTV